MAKILWHLKYPVVLLALFAAFAACIKERDPNFDRDQIKTAIGEIVKAINAKDLSALSHYFPAQPQAGRGPNALLSEIAVKTDSVFTMYRKRFSVNRQVSIVRFTFSNSPDDSLFSFLKLVNEGGWKIADFQIH